MTLFFGSTKVNDFRDIWSSLWRMHPKNWLKSVSIVKEDASDTYRDAIDLTKRCFQDKSTDFLTDKILLETLLEEVLTAPDHQRELYLDHIIRTIPNMPIPKNAARSLKRTLRKQLTKGGIDE